MILSHEDRRKIFSILGKYRKTIKFIVKPRGAANILYPFFTRWGFTSLSATAQDLLLVFNQLLNVNVLILRKGQSCLYLGYKHLSILAVV